MQRRLLVLIRHTLLTGLLMAGVAQAQGYPTLREQAGDFGEIVYAGMDWVDPVLARRSMELMATQVMLRVNEAIKTPAKAASAVR